MYSQIAFCHNFPLVILINYLHYIANSFVDQWEMGHTISVIEYFYLNDTQN